MTEFRCRELVVVVFVGPVQRDRGHVPVQSGHVQAAAELSHHRQRAQSLLHTRRDIPGPPPPPLIHNTYLGRSAHHHTSTTHPNNPPTSMNRPGSDGGSSCE